MSSVIPSAQSSSPSSSRMEALKKVCQFDYLLHIAGMIFSLGVLSVVALIINYIKRDDATGTIFESHMNWMIRTFWWWLLWVVVLGVIGVLSFGILWFLLTVPWIWFLYRMVKGLLRLNDGQAMPA